MINYLVVVFGVCFLGHSSGWKVMSRSVDPLVVGRVIGDVIDMFEPSVDMAVLYTSRQVLQLTTRSHATQTFEFIKICGGICTTTACSRRRSSPHVMCCCAPEMPTIQ